MSDTDTKAKASTTDRLGGDAQQEKSADAEATNKLVQDVFDVEQDQGFRGTKVDPTPNEHYTVEGVTGGKPTPETDVEAARAADGAVRVGRFDPDVSTVSANSDKAK